MNNISASSNTTKAPTFPYTSDIPWVVAYSLQFFISIIGNVLILWIVYKDNRLKTTTNYLVANMAVSDLLAALIVIPNPVVSITTGNRLTPISNIHLGNAICKVTSFAETLCFIVSIYTCVFIAIDRYYAVAHPFGRHFQRKIKYIITGIWFWASILNAPQLHFHIVEKIGNKFICTVSSIRSYKVYIYFLLSATSGLAFVFLIITYTLTVYKLYRHKAPGLPNSAVRRREKQNKKVLKMAVTVVALLYLCHGTWFIYNMLRFEGHLSPDSRRKLNLASVFVLFLSLCYNLFVYLVFNDIYRENIKAMISKCCWYCGFKRTLDISDNCTIPGPTAVVEMKTTVNMPN